MPKIVDVTSAICKNTDADYAEDLIDYFSAVKRCLRNITGEVEAIKICNDHHSYLLQGMDQKNTPSQCALFISKLIKGS